MLKKAIVIFFTTALLMTMTVSPYATTQNFLFNGSFEQLVDGTPANWIMESYDKDPGASTFEVETADPQLGERYVTITNNVTNDSRYLQAVMVEENKKYKLSCYIKAENVSEEGKGANLSVGSQLITSKQIKGTTEGWEYVEMYAVIEEGAKTMNVSVGVGGYSGTSTGKASFDNVLMEEVELIPEGAPVAIIKPLDKGSSNNNNNDNNNNNNNNSTNNTPQQNNEGKDGLGKVVWIVLILAVFVVGVATFNTIKSSKKPSEESSDIYNGIDSNEDADSKDNDSVEDEDGNNEV